MDSESQVRQLEAALLEQAESLAREQHALAEAARERMLAESAQRLKIAEENEVLSARADAERLVRRQTQSAETRLAAELDRLRWALTEATLVQLRLTFQDLVADADRYLPVLESWLAAAARQLPPGDLQVAVRPADLPLLDANWTALAARAAPGRRADLVPLDVPSEGGLLVRLADGRAQLDQTFEARQARLGDELARITMEHLFASAPDLGTLARG